MQINPQGKKKGDCRVVRGGDSQRLRGFYNRKHRVAVRFFNCEHYRIDCDGFRIVMVIENGK